MTTVNRNFQYIVEGHLISNIESLYIRYYMVEAAHNFEVTSQSNHVISNMTVTKCPNFP